MQMLLYHSDNKPNVINKNLIQLRTVNIILREMVDEKRPSLLLHDDTVADSNYCYLPDFKRYYFIEQVNRYNSHLVKVFLACDLLMTYKDELLKQNVLITATSTPSYLSNSLPTNDHIEEDRYTSDITLPDAKTIILTTIGGQKNAITLFTFNNY